MEEDEILALRKHAFKKKLEELAAYKGRATEMISLYVPSSTQVSDAVKYLNNEYAQSSNIKSQTTRKNVTAAISSIMSRLKQYKTVPPNGLVFFIGTVIVGNNKTEMVYHVLEPPEPVRGFLYRCDSSFFLEPLEEMITDKEFYGLVVIDRSEATVGALHGTRIEVIMNLQSMVPSKHGRGGQSQRRFERLIEDAAHQFFKKVGDVMTDAFLNKKDLVHILVGGPGSTKEYFIEKDYIHHELKKKLLDPINTGYTDEYGLKELVDNAEDLLKNVELVREKKVMERFFREVSKKDGGLAAYGAKEVRTALENNAVDTLILSSELPTYRLHFVCNNPECREKVVRESKEKSIPVLCPKCGGNMELIKSEDVIEAYINLASEGGASVKFISADFDEGAMLMNAFKGIAALLRYKMES